MLEKASKKGIGKGISLIIIGFCVHPIDVMSV